MSILFIVLGSLYILICVALISVIIFQKKDNSGLGNLSGMGQTYWDKNKKNSLDGKLENFTKIIAVLYFIFTAVMCFIK